MPSSTLLLALPLVAGTPLSAFCRPSDRQSLHQPPVPLLSLRGGAAEAGNEAREKLSSWFSSQRSKLSQPAKAIDPDRTKATALLKKRGVANAGKAQQLLRAALKRDPDNVDVKLELADAINMEIRIRTNANSLVIEGVQDSPAFKKIWRTLGSESYALAKEARKEYPSSVKVLAVYADSFLYTASAKGIVKQALTGVGKQYLSIAKELYKYPEWDAAVGCCFMGGFYNCAPWPGACSGQAYALLSLLSPRPCRDAFVLARMRARSGQQEDGAKVPAGGREDRPDAAQPVLCWRQRLPNGRLC